MQQQYEQQNETTRYIPVPDRPVITEPHIEDYLDHVCAPLIGILSYDDRQRFRESKREELEAIIRAHIELGSTREEAIAATLLARTVPNQIGTNPVSERSVQTVENTVVNHTAWHKSQRTAFALSAGNALIGLPLVLTIAKTIQPHFYTWDLRIAAMAVLPAITGCALGHLSPYKAGKAWRWASLLTLPLIALSYTVCIWYFWRASFMGDVGIILAVSPLHAAVSALFGSIGAWGSSAFRKAQRTQRSEAALRNVPSS